MQESLEMVKGRERKYTIDIFSFLCYILGRKEFYVMAKISRDDFSKKYVDKFTSDDVGIEFLEDLSDSFTNEDVVKKSEYDDINTKYEELKEKYKSRFLDVESEKLPFPEKKEELEEREFIDIKSIFKR